MIYRKQPGEFDRVGDRMASMLTADDNMQRRNRRIEKLSH